MKNSLRLVVAITSWLTCGLTSIPAQVAPIGNAATPARQHLGMDANWRFALGHPFDTGKDFNHATGYFSYFAKAGYADGPASPSFDDRAWRVLDLPHDWAVEAPFDPKASSSHGYKAIGRAFPDRSVGWYRKTFAVPAADLGRHISVDFDGVFRDSVVWVNGFYLGRQPSGYTSFQYDITDYLNYGGDNVISVRVDATMEEGWFYEGAGIYRHVWLTKTAPLHVAHWGTFVSTGLQKDNAVIDARTTVVNEGTTRATFDIDQRIVDASGKAVAEGAVVGATLEPGISTEFPCVINVANPQRWTLENPVLHRLVTTIRSGGNVIDHYETPFGIRSVRFDPNEGFFLNDKRVEIKGANMHQDHAGVGVALPDALQSYRLAQLKDFGCNAYRCSHNPPTPELLDAADRLGILVIDETRLMGPSPEQLSQLSSMVRRDRNHPSVVLWSIGNEEWAIEGNIKGARIAASMQTYVQRLDPTRRVTAAISGGWGGISTTIDVVGYNYIKQSNSDKQHAEFPHQPGLGTEESTTRQTRGIYIDNPAQGHLAPLLDASSGGNMELGWQHYAARSYLAGVVYWTGFDYRGEPNPYGWPQVNSQSGILDLCGFLKDGAYYLKAWWRDEPIVHLFPHWNWPGKEGQKIDVWCYSNCDDIELRLNGRSLGSKKMPRNGHLEWEVNYEPGLLEAHGFRGGRPLAIDKVETTGAAVALALAADRTSIQADGTDVSVLTISALDAKGRLVPTADNAVHLNISGGRIIGVGNGDPANREPETFTADHTVITIEDWRGRIVPADTAIPTKEVSPPLSELGKWRAPQPKPDEVYDLSATFLPGSITPHSQLRLFLPTLGKRITLWLNGQELSRDLDTSQVGPALPLDSKMLVAGVNRLSMLVVPQGDGKNRIPELTRMGAISVIGPEPATRCRLFNGLAQVIVQTSHKPGPIVLTAQSEGLPPVDASVTAQPAAAGESAP
jgi:beta-galactosidase